MKILLRLSIFFFLLASCGSQQETANAELQDPDFTIAFGSCNKQDEKQPLWRPILKNEPDVFVWGGDNIYADSRNMKEIEAGYKEQKKNKNYQKMLASVEVMGTWDDHDYGKNDGGAAWEYRDESQQLFLDFFNVPEDSERRDRRGVYEAQTFKTEEGSLKIISLDTRYFRTPLKKSDDPDKRYEPSEGDMLGAEQWQWLEQELVNSEADFNVIMSSIQVLSKEHGFETWGNFPDEVEKLKSIIRYSGAKNVILLSGDRHISEFSKTEVDGLGYPLIDFTSSGLTHVYEEFSGEPNQYRVGKVVNKISFGLLKFDFDKGLVLMEMRGKKNRLLQEYRQIYP
ncbi:alkaline phosphatase D family protein [Salegentibacter chungangensis]|uniref:Alkaline phosphatase D family protein n=1 Tax=Salegentibacter chungangensis TaxID=1335724 RepID=A0ABW3NRI6_9FLAO